MESYKHQIEEKKNIVESMTTQDTKLMKEMLYYRNQILDFDKDNEKEMLKMKSDIDTTLLDKKQETMKKLSVGDVRLNEIKESLFSKESILNEKIITEF